MHSGWTAAAASLFAAAALSAQTAPPHDSHVMPALSRELLERPVPPRTGIGTAHDAVSTGNPQAQAYYDQGLVELHSYDWIEAARSFHQALRLDGTLAMAEIGLSYAWVELNAPAEAHAALARARTLAVGASDHDRRHVALRSDQMAAEDAPADATRRVAYRRALDEALEAFPRDAELWLMRGLAESNDSAERGQGCGLDSVRFFERALALAPSQIAAHHYLAHAFENAGRVDDALAQADMYARLAPQVPHARHMLGHTMRRSGKMDDAVAEFEAADRLDVEYIEREHIPPALDWHYHHNLDLLAASYWYVGNGTKAEALLKKAFAMPSASLEQELNKRAWPMFLVARGRAGESLEAADVMRSHTSPLVRAMGYIQAGEARLALRQAEMAAADADAALRLMRASPEGAGLVAPALRQLQGELLLRRGERAQGRALLERAATEIRGAPGPDGWAQALFALEAMARAARENGDWELAVSVARQMREQDPNYSGTQAALTLAARHIVHEVTP
jgi:tetratricopeptide (TPR) repeat protein